MLKRITLGAAMAVSMATTAQAITIDGLLDLEYGGPTATVGFDAAAPMHNFGAPGSTNHNVGYDIYLNGSGGYVYGFLDADGSTNGLDFANLYFNIDGVGGSDLGFEITNLRAFIPGVGGYAATPDILFQIGAGTLEFAIPVAYFTSEIAGLTYGASTPSVGDTVQLRLSQSLGYSVAGGASFGPERLGEVTLTAVPEPATWAMMIVGFGAAGAVLRRRAAVSAV